MIKGNKTIAFVIVMIFLFIVNIAVSSLCMLFLDLTFRECLIYSAINGIWMAYLIPPVMKRFQFFIKR